MPEEDDPLRARFSQVSGLIESARTKASALEHQDRSFIAKRVVWLYIAIVVACFAFVIGANWLFTVCTTDGQTGCLAWQGPAEFLLQVLTTAVLPIVTLVLGYYFGTASSGDADDRG